MKRMVIVMLAAILFCGCRQLKNEPTESEPSTALLSPTDDASQFVVLAEAIPDVILEIRYYSTYNFVGKRVDGYLEPGALLTHQAADSLRAVTDDLLKQDYRLKIYDAYRPQCAVDHFVRWAADVNDTLMKPYFYPDVPRDWVTSPKRVAIHAALQLT